MIECTGMERFLKSFLLHQVPPTIKLLLHQVLLVWHRIGSSESPDSWHKGYTGQEDLILAWVELIYKITIYGESYFLNINDCLLQYFYPNFPHHKGLHAVYREYLPPFLGSAVVPGIRIRRQHGFEQEHSLISPVLSLPEATVSTASFFQGLPYLVKQNRGHISWLTT